MSEANLYPDRPIEAHESDLLERGPFVQSLTQTLVVDRRDTKGELAGRKATGYVVGLTGEWGAGKSSILNLLYEQLDSMDHVVVALFNPWLFAGRDELVTGFFNTLRTALGRSNEEDVRALVTAVDRYWGAINFVGHGVAAIADVHGGSGAATALWKKFWPKVRGAVVKPQTWSPDKERASLERKIADSGLAVVVLIDELDRIEDNEVRAVAQLVKAVGDIKGLSYLVAYDPARVIEALGRNTDDERRRSGERYLEKIIQYPIPLRPLFAEDVDALLKSALSDCGVTLPVPRTESQKKIFTELVKVIETPRDVKRLVGAFSILERAVRGEICAFDVLAYSWIATKAPTVRIQITKHIDELVSDPSDRGMSDRLVRRMNKESEPNLLQSLGEAAQEHLAMLQLLFPRFTEKDHVDDRERLTRRRNLVRMLYLGNPPGAVRRADVEDLWRTTDVTTLEADLRQKLREGTLASILDRVDELVHTLPETGDQTFWVAMSRALMRSTWPTTNDNTGALADDAALTLKRLATRNSDGVGRLIQTIEALISDGDLLFVPDLIRSDLFAHGLSQQPARGNEVLSRKQTEDLLSRELPRYRQAVLDGTFLRQCPTAELLFVFANLGAFDSEMRSSMTAQLNSREALQTIATLLTPPGVRIDLATLAMFFDVDLVRDRFAKELEGIHEDTDEWIFESMMAMLRTLKGRDSLFPDEND